MSFVEDRWILLVGKDGHALVYQAEEGRTVRADVQRAAAWFYNRGRSDLAHIELLPRDYALFRMELVSLYELLPLDADPGLITLSVRMAGPTGWIDVRPLDLAADVERMREQVEAGMPGARSFEARTGPQIRIGDESSTPRRPSR